MKRTGVLLVISILFIVFYSCRKIETLPPIPHIEYQSFQIFDTTDPLGNLTKGGRLKFYFEDGDGDVGLKSPDNNNPSDTNNLRISLYRKQNGIMKQVPDTVDDALRPSSYRIPFMEREGQNKILRGVISVTMFYLFYTPRDTISYEFYIIDRANNESNKVMTGEIIVSVNNTY
jgi:hypothetical protein